MGKLENAKELKVRERRSGKERVNEQKKCLEVCFISSEFHRQHLILRSYQLLR
jgi:hypothetical protein